MGLSESCHYYLLTVTLQEWTDSNMRWNTTEYNNVKDIRVPPNTLWKPDILMYNSASEAFDSTYPTNVVVTSEGTCTYIPPGGCPSQNIVKTFPFPEIALTVILCQDYIQYCVPLFLVCLI